MTHNFIADKATLDAVKVDTTDIRAVVNAMPTGDMRGRAVFTANGTFTVPSWVTEIMVSACASGSNGTPWIWNGSNYTPGPGGRAGEYAINYKAQVTPNSNLSITVGTGNTVVGAFLTLISSGGSAGIGYDGASGPFGSGGKAGVDGSTHGTNGKGFGSGGGGGKWVSSWVSSNPGEGAPGIVIIEW